MAAQSHAHSHGRRFGRAQNDDVIDPYARAANLHEPVVCPDCVAIYRRGRWQWGKADEDAKASTCPACQRIADGLPAGVITLHGPLSPERKAEIVNLFRHQEAAEKAEHPLGRIMAIEDARSDDSDAISVR